MTGCDAKMVRGSSDPRNVEHEKALDVYPVSQWYNVFFNINSV